MADPDELASRFREFGVDTATRSTLYSGLAADISREPAVIELLRAAPDTQQLPVLLFAAVHDLVLRRDELELAAWYPTVTDRPETTDPWPVFAATCREFADEIRATIATRSTQTNEVGRCALYLPALGSIADEMGELSLVDVGASAGLNLLLDHYEYRFEPGGTVGAPSSVVLVAGTRGEPPMPTPFPAIAVRLGIDRSPVDLSNASSARWLLACLWPDQAERVERLRAAIAIANEHPVDVREGDAVSSVADAIDAVADAGHPVVMNSWVLNYLTVAERLSYVAELDRVGAERDLSWVFAESPSMCEGLPMPGEARHASLTLVMLVRWREGMRTVEHLATAHPHGQWIHWGDAKESFAKK